MLSFPFDYCVIEPLWCFLAAVVLLIQFETLDILLVWL